MNNHELKCPYCNGPVNVAKVTCSKCKISVEGRFDLPSLALLDPKEAIFLAEYALAGFSIKELEKRVKMSYPAIRARLDRIIKNLRIITQKMESRKDILNMVERGEISADEAIRMIESL